MTALETSSLGKVGALGGSLHITVSSKRSHLLHQETDQEEAEPVHMEVRSSLQSRSSTAPWLQGLEKGIGVSRRWKSFLILSACKQY